LEPFQGREIEPQRYFRELSEEVLTRKMNWYNGISVDLKMVTDTMTEQ